MDDARAVRVRESPRHLAQHPGGLAWQQRTARADTLAECDPVDVRHDDVHEAATLAGGIDGNDVRVTQPRDRLRFAEKGLAQIGASGERRRQHLDRDGPSQPRLAREIDDAHAAAAELPLERVLAGQCFLHRDEIDVRGLAHGW